MSNSPWVFSTNMTFESELKFCPVRIICWPPRTEQLSRSCFSTMGSSWAERWAAETHRGVEHNFYGLSSDAFIWFSFYIKNLRPWMISFDILTTWIMCWSILTRSSKVKHLPAVSTDVEEGWFGVALQLDVRLLITQKWENSWHKRSEDEWYRNHNCDFYFHWVSIRMSQITTCGTLRTTLYVSWFTGRETQKQLKLKKHSLSSFPCFLVHTFLMVFFLKWWKSPYVIQNSFIFSFSYYIARFIIIDRSEKWPTINIKSDWWKFRTVVYTGMKLKAKMSQIESSVQIIIIRLREQTVIHFKPVWRDVL